MNCSASSRVNLPAACRCVNPIGPRASLKSLCPASLSNSSSSRTCFADAGGPLGCPNAMGSFWRVGMTTRRPDGDLRPWARSRRGPILDGGEERGEASRVSIPFGAVPREEAMAVDDEFEILVEELDEPSCWRLLSRAGFGRVGLLHDGEIVVLPVNAAVVDRRVVFRTADESMLAAGDGTTVAFEADHTDRVAESGWSVLVRGRLVDVTERPETAAWHELTVRPWLPGPRTAGWWSNPRPSRAVRSIAAGSCRMLRACRTCRPTEPRPPLNRYRGPSPLAPTVFRADDGAALGSRGLPREGGASWGRGWIGSQCWSPGPHGCLVLAFPSSGTVAVRTCGSRRSVRTTSSSSGSRCLVSTRTAISTSRWRTAC